MGVFANSPSLRTMFARVLRSPITRQLAFQRSLRFNSDALGLEAAPLHSTKPTITIVDGDGIGPELMDSVVGVLSAAEVPITWERFSSHGNNELDVDELIISLSSNRVGLKGPLYTPVHGKASRNMRIRRAIDLFANVVPIRNIPGIETRHKDVDFVVIRENTEGEYSGLEHLVAPGVVQSLKVITRSASLRIAGFESGARHVGFDISGKNVADPIGSLLTSVMMLRHLKMNSFASRIEEAVFDTIKENQVRTRDIGGSNTTREVTKAVIDKLI